MTGFLVVAALVVAVFFLYKSMTRHLRKVPASFDPPVAAGSPVDAAQAPEASEPGGGSA